jgi:malonate-semialdehyde dehydrogenase (acetylating)/methylmalonate-semialdehyde dehydrogenase
MMPGLNSFSLSQAEELSSQWKGTNFLGGTTKNFIDGEFRESKTEKWIDVLDPVSLHQVVPQLTAESCE